MGSQSGIEAAVVGADLEVPLLGGASARYVNLDYAASAPALVEVWAAVQAFLPWYSSVHRGAGFKSQVATAAYEGAREPVRALSAVGPMTRSCSRATQLTPSTCSPAACPPVRLSSPPASNTTPTCSPGEGTARSSCLSRQVPTNCWKDSFLGLDFTYHPQHVFAAIDPALDAQAVPRLRHSQHLLL